MLLGLSGGTVGDDIDLSAIAGGGGVPHGELLVRLVDASFEEPSDAQSEEPSDDANTLAAVRRQCLDTIGYEAMVDAVAVIANFHMMTRIADATGTPLDSGSQVLYDEIREVLGIDGFESKRLDPTASGP